MGILDEIERLYIWYIELCCGGRVKKSFMGGVVTTLLATNVMQYWFVANANQRGPIEPMVESVVGTVVERQSPVVKAVQQVSPTVVAITTEVATQSPFAWIPSGTSSSEGSGVVIDEKGIVLTNAHVVEGAIAIKATFSDESTFEAEIIGLEPELDLAVLRLKKSNSSPAVAIGTSEGLLLGETVIALGNPFGLGHTVTTGVISAIDRPLETERRIYQNFIQTDASINPGNSGGPLVNIKGELVGINTAIRSNAEGIGFAIPVDRAMKVAQDILNFGRVQRPWLGVDIDDVVFQMDGKRRVVPQVSWVYPDNTIFQKKDTILSIDGKDVQGRGDLNAYLSTLNPGKEVRVEVWRNGQTREVKLRTDALPSFVVDMAIEDVLGIELAMRQSLLVVSRINSEGAFARNGLKSGDQVLAVNGQRVSNLEDLRTILSNAKSDHKGSAIFTIRRGRYQGQVELPI